MRTFTDGMRYQLGPASGVSLVEVVPPLVETAMTEGRGSGKITAEEAAARIAEGLERGRERIYVGKAKLISRLYRVSPELVGRILRHG